MASLRGGFLFGFLIATPLILIPACGPSGESLQKEKARAQAELFLNSVKNGDGKAAYSLLSHDYLSRLSFQEERAKALKLSDWAVGSRTVTGWKIQEEHFNGQPHFKGVFHSKDDKGNEKDYTFELKLATTASDGKVSFFTSEAAEK